MKLDTSTKLTDIAGLVGCRTRPHPTGTAPFNPTSLKAQILTHRHQGPNIAVQTVLPKHEIPIGLSLIGFVQFFSSTIIVTVCQSLLQNRLMSGLSGKIPGFDPRSIAGQGATSLRTLVAPEYLPVVLKAYNEALRSVWYVGLGLACLTFVASLGFEWRSVKGEKKEGDAESAGDEREIKGGSKATDQGEDDDKITSRG